MLPSCTIYRAKAEVDMCSENFQKNSGCRGNPEKKKIEHKLESRKNYRNKI